MDSRPFQEEKKSLRSIIILYIPFFVTLLYSCGATDSKEQVKTASANNTRIKVGNAPGCVEIADLDHDDIPDLVVTSDNDSNVTILLGKTKRRFEEVPGSPFAAGHGVNDVAIGDYNKDGHRDLAFANHERKYLTVLLGNGKGNFAAAPGSPFPVQGIPHTHGIATGDFNNDGWPDLATDSWGNDQVEIIFGDSARLFKPGTRFFKVGKRPYQRLRAQDVNGDGVADIVTTNSEGNNATILLCDSKGGFTEAPGSPFACGDAPFGLAIGDLNADGKPDLAIINSPASMAEGRGRNGLTILLGDGTGKFSATNRSPYEAGRIPNRVAIGDINGDGINDVATSDNDDNKIYIFLVKKDGNLLSASSITVGNHPKGISIADLDSDGKGDIVVCNNLDNDISIIFGK